MRTNNEIREKIVKMYIEGYSVARIMPEVGIKSSRTIYKVLNDAGVTSTERQEREADVINITLTDAAVVQWLRSQPNAAEAIAKLVYSQIEGSQKQNSRIADSTVVTDKDIPVTFLDENGLAIGEETVHVTAGTSQDMFFDIVKSMRDTTYPQAVEATNKSGSCHIIFS